MNKPTGVARERVKEGIWRRKNAKGAWVYEIVFRNTQGKQIRQTVKGGGLREAEAELGKARAKIRTGENIVPVDRNLTFAIAAEKWWTERAQSLAPKTQTTYRYGLDTHLLPYFGAMRLSDIDVGHVAAFIAAMRTAEYRREVEGRTTTTRARRTDIECGYSVQTMKSVLIPFSRAFDYAKRHKMTAAENPVRALEDQERPGYRARKAKKPKLNREQLDAVIAAATSPHREVIATAAALGTRKGETLGLRWGDIDFDRRTVRIERQANARGQLVQTKTQTSERVIEAPDFLMAMFAALKLRTTRHAGEDLIFASKTGRPLGHGNVLARGLYPALERAGLPQMSFHSLRHSHASLWIKDGGDIVTLSKRLGHASVQVTISTYVSEIEEANDDRVRRAQVERMYKGTKMAAIVAATDRHEGSETTAGEGAEVVALPGAA
ncbi:MAG: site-specific integrase [Gemmatimonadaceae bacterium]|nr:site-specific integrase [Gemmatimonadaceae bacterium]